MFIDMINKENLSIYNKYSGNVDAWARLGDSTEKSIINDSIWFEIDNLHQDIELINKGFAANDYKQKIIEKIKNLCSDIESADFFNSKLNG